MKLVWTRLQGADHNFYVVYPANSTPIHVRFQNGNPAVTRENGLTMECLLEISIDRLKFLNTLAPCPENDLALQHMQGALDALNSRSQRVEAQNAEKQAAV